MENAADALKIAFAVFVFILAITITFSLISQAKSTADVVFYHTDKTNFYEYANSSNNKNREVSVMEVISTLYRFYKESIAVTVNLGNESRTFDLSNSNYLDVATIEKELGTYIKENLIDNNYLSEESTFIEEFVEVPISGIYQTGNDGTEITLASGGKKIYVTYTLKEGV